ncbi:MAG: hypothetical protein ACLFPG_04035 [Desulfohalobiaceae bacterium]
MYPSEHIYQGNIRKILAEIKEKDQKRRFLEALAYCDYCTCGRDRDEWAGICLLRRKTEAQNFAYEYMKTKTFPKLS